MGGKNRFGTFTGPAAEQTVDIEGRSGSFSFQRRPTRLTMYLRNFEVISEAIFIDGQ